MIEKWTYFILIKIRQIIGKCEKTCQGIVFENLDMCILGVEYSGFLNINLCTQLRKKKKEYNHWKHELTSLFGTCSACMMLACPSSKTYCATFIFVYCSYFIVVLWWEINISREANDDNSWLWEISSLTLLAAKWKLCPVVKLSRSICHQH